MRCEPREAVKLERAGLEAGAEGLRRDRVVHGHPPFGRPKQRNELEIKGNKGTASWDVGMF